ncbi:reverse transcriptase, partial [Globisporangium splendens]
MIPQARKQHPVRFLVPLSRDAQTLLSTKCSQSESRRPTACTPADCGQSDISRLKVVHNPTSSWSTKDPGGVSSNAACTNNEQIMHESTQFCADPTAADPSLTDDSGDQTNHVERAVGDHQDDGVSLVVDDQPELSLSPSMYKIRKEKSCGEVQVLPFIFVTYNIHSPNYSTKIGITPGHDPAIWIFSLDLPHTPTYAWTTIKRHIIGHKCSNEHLQDHLYPVAHMLWRYMSASLIQAIWCAHLRRMDSDPIGSTAEMAIMMTRLEAGMRNLTRLAEAQAGDSDGHTVAAVLKAYVDCFLSQTGTIPLTPSDTRGVYLLFFDGGSRGNPGPGGTGSIIARVHKDSHTASLIWAASMAYSRKDTTNNFAEYWGLIHGLREAQRSHFEPLYVIGDSALIISQHRMHRSPRQHRLARLYQTSRRLADCIDIRGWYHHYRAFNKMADSAANLAMDTRTSTQVHFPTQRAAFNNLTQDLDNDVMHWLVRSSEDPRSLDNTRQPHIGPREHAILVKDYLAFRSDLLQSAL